MRGMDPSSEAYKLTRLSRWVYLLGVIVLIGFVGQIVVLLTVGYIIATGQPLYQLRDIVPFSIFMFVINLCVLLGFETMRKYGDAIFFALTDELQERYKDDDDYRSNFREIHY